MSDVAIKIKGEYATKQFNRSELDWDKDIMESVIWDNWCFAEEQLISSMHTKRVKTGSLVFVEMDRDNQIHTANHTGKIILEWEYKFKYVIASSDNYVDSKYLMSKKGDVKEDSNACLRFDSFKQADEFRKKHKPTYKVMELFEKKDIKHD